MLITDTDSPHLLQRGLVDLNCWEKISPITIFYIKNITFEINNSKLMHFFTEIIIS